MINELDITVPVTVVGYIDVDMPVSTQTVSYEMALGMAVMEERGEYHPDIFQRFFQDEEEYRPEFDCTEDGTDWEFKGFRLIVA